MIATLEALIRSIRLIILPFFEKILLEIQYKCFLVFSELKFEKKNLKNVVILEIGVLYGKIWYIMSIQSFFDFEVLRI